MKIENMKPVESFCNDEAFHAAVCLKMGWAEGKDVTKEEYEAAVNAFMSAPAGSYRRKK